MKSIVKKSEIKSSLLKGKECVEFKGFKLGFDKNEKLYFIGKLFNNQVYSYYETINDLRQSI